MLVRVCESSEMNLLLYERRITKYLKPLVESAGWR